MAPSGFVGAPLLVVAILSIGFAACGDDGAESTTAPSDTRSSTRPSDLAELYQEEVQKCIIDTRTLRTAAEAFYAQNGRYPVGSAELVTAGFLSEESTRHAFAVDTSGGFPRADIVVKDAVCGVPGHSVGEDPTDY